MRGCELIYNTVECRGIGRVVGGCVVRVDRGDLELLVWDFAG